jgi:hypothetical protein
MAVKRDGEKYLGAELRVPLSEDGQVAAYVWPVRIVVIQGMACGGPTIGVDVGNQEIMRFDCHDAPGHWHSGGYDSTNPGGSQKSMPDGLVVVADQLEWSMQQIRENVCDLLAEANHGAAAQKVSPKLLSSALDSIKAHLASQDDLRNKAIADKLIAS